MLLEAAAMAESDLECPPISKKPKRASRWQPEWKGYNMMESRKGPNFEFCLCDFSVSSGGFNDVKRHIESQKHKEFSKCMEGQSSMMSFSKKDSLEDQVTKAELYFTTFIAEHNLSFLTADHFTKVCKVMFPDSKIALGYASGRTKTAAIIKHALAPAVNSEVIHNCQTSPFTRLCDGGNDQWDRKYFAIMVKYWDKKLCTVVTRFLAMSVCNVATAQALFDAMEGELNSHSIPWCNVIGFASDTDSVMVGAHNSVLSRLRQKQPKVFSFGCICHLAALCSVAGLKKLPVSVDELLIDIFYHFKHSSKRWAEFSEILQEFDEIKPLRVLKHCSTRWLSLKRCIK